MNKNFGNMSAKQCHCGKKSIENKVNTQIICMKLIVVMTNVITAVCLRMMTDYLFISALYTYKF